VPAHIGASSFLFWFGLCFFWVAFVFVYGALVTSSLGGVCSPGWCLIALGFVRQFLRRGRGRNAEWRVRFLSSSSTYWKAL
jgi:hypothetical protein